MSPGGVCAGALWHDAHTTPGMQLHMEWGLHTVQAFAHTHLWMPVCPYSCQCATCNSSLPCARVLGAPGSRTCCHGWHAATSCPRAQQLCARVPAGSRSEGLRSPSESVFLRMEGIPFIQEELADNEENSKRQSESGRGAHTHEPGAGEAMVP